MTFESYPPALIHEKAEELAKSLATELIQAVFAEIDPEALVRQSELASTLPTEQQALVAKLIDTARIEMRFSWE